LLAFDTSTEVLALAVHGPQGAFTERAAGGAAASAALLPALQALMQRAGVAMHQVQAIAFGQGPGAFTGLRTSCAVAQGLGLGLDRPVLPLDSLLLVAEDARAQLAADDLDVLVLVDARMDEVYAGLYRWTGQAWQVLQPPGLYSLPGLAGLLTAVEPDRPVAVAGSALNALGERLGLSAGAGWRFCPQETDRAVALLQLARRAWADGAAVDAAQALPLYLRDKVAQTTAEREALKRAAAGATPAQGA
jgi:tRNA threonylcarbamoyladenosine biosynthesis protein TsaB